MKQLRVLIVDNDRFVVEAVGDVLAEAGYLVRKAYDGLEGLRALRREPPDVLILDLIMPTMDGREWLRWFRQMRKDSPVIVISAYKFVDEDGTLQPTAILEKPFHVAELLDLVGLFCGLSTPSASVV